MVGFSYTPRAVLTDAFVLGGLLLLVRFITGRSWPQWLLGLAIAGLFIAGSGVKTILLGLPIGVADGGPLLALFDILEGSRLVAAVAGTIVFVVLLAWGLWPAKGRKIWLMLVPLYVVTIPGLVWLSHADDVMGNEDGSDRPEILAQRGGLVYLATDAVRNLRGEKVPSEASVLAVVGAHRARHSDLRPSQDQARNIHLILVESFWNVTTLDGFSFSADPWDQRIREWWDAGGRSGVLSPVFGGATANAEFEVLCGLPATGGGRVVFSEGISNDLPCLPAMLAAHGYLTMASHPYKRNFWNRDTAYAKVGFEQYLPDQAFDADDRDGMFLNDRSMLFQSLARVNLLRKDRPYFSYIVTLSSHYPYKRDKEKRPDRVRVTPQAQTLQDYANAISYTTEALADYVQALQENDPDALIVIFGDHAPVLDSSPDPYEVAGLRNGGALEPGASSRLSTTPLIVIDGRNGPRSVGTQPLYELAPKIAAWATQGRVSLPHADVVLHQKVQTRDFLASLLVERKGDWQICAGGGADCRTARDNRKALGALRNDMVWGRQYALHALGAKDVGQHGMTINRDHYGCIFDVEAWGPQEGQRGQAMNRQPSGSSALWFKLRNIQGDPTVSVDGEEADMMVSGDAASASFSSPQFIHTAGEHYVSFQCEDEAPVSFGKLLIQP